MIQKALLPQSRLIPRLLIPQSSNSLRKRLNFPTTTTTQLHRHYTSHHIITRSQIWPALTLTSVLALIPLNFWAMPRRKFQSATLNTGSTDASSLTDTADAPPKSIPSTFNDSLRIPQVIVFDLDYTLWPFWIDTHPYPPLKPNNDNTGMIDRTGDTYTFYPEVPSILYEAKRRNILLGLASRTHTPDLANQTLRAINVPVPEQYLKEQAEGQEAPQKAISFFAFREIYPGAKTRHFKQIQASTKTMARKEGNLPREGIAFEDMLFFDDESRNRDVERELGVTFYLVRDGVTRDEIDKGVWEWRKRRGITKEDLKSKDPSKTDSNDYEQEE